MATYRQVVQHLRALAHQTGPLRCAERRYVGDGEMTRASITYEQQRLVDAKSDYQRRTRRSQNMHRGQPHPAAARIVRYCRAALRVSERVAIIALAQRGNNRLCYLGLGFVVQAPVKTRNINEPSSRCFLPRVPAAARSSLAGESGPADRAPY